MESILVILVAFVRFSSSEWTPNSLVQPGPCPAVNPQQFFDFQRVKGRWQVVQMPQNFPICCKAPILEVLDTPTSPVTTNGTSPSPGWKTTVDWTSCSDEMATLEKKWSLGLWPNPMLAGSFAVKLPWPLNLAGFTTLNVINSDSSSYTAVYICHSLLLEHILVPVILKRESAELNTSELHRLKWSLIRSSVLSAWDLVDSVRDECNSLPASVTLPPPHSGSSTTLASAISQNDSINFPTEPSKPTKLPNDPVDDDPDSEAEWITTESNYLKPGEDPSNFPDEFPYPGAGPVPLPPVNPWFPGIPRPPFVPPLPPGPNFGGLWPPFFFSKDQQTPRAGNDSHVREIPEDPATVLPLPPDPENGRMAHLIQNNTN